MPFGRKSFAKVAIYGIKVGSGHFLMGFIGLLRRLLSGRMDRRPLPPELVKVREARDKRAAVVFVHGFSGRADETWGEFPKLLASHPALQNWAVFSLGYASSLRVDVPNIWAADPPLDRLVVSLCTALTTPPISEYQAVAIMAHSMGGLIVQGALLEEAVARRVGFVTLYGTPSNGLIKASLIAGLKRQLSDMSEGSHFINNLRQKWASQFGHATPFRMLVVAGERDEFVPATSSLGPFPREIQRVVPGSHLEMVKPLTVDDRSVQLAIALLTDTLGAPSRVDSALVAAEHREFQSVIETLSGSPLALDPAAAVLLALALDAVGRREEAIRLLEVRELAGQLTTDARGVLAGRYKRLWLSGREQRFWERARHNYVQGLERAAPASGNVGNVDQAMYHSINIAFLDLLVSPPQSTVSPEVRAMAQRALAYAHLAADSHWKWATLGDAQAMLGDLNAACEAYTRAAVACSRAREASSMYSQAVRIAGHLYGAHGAARIESCFNVAEAASTRLGPS